MLAKALLSVPPIITRCFDIVIFRRVGVAVAPRCFFFRVHSCADSTGRSRATRAVAGLFLGKRFVREFCRVHVLRSILSRHLQSIRSSHNEKLPRVLHYRRFICETCPLSLCNVRRQYIASLHHQNAAAQEELPTLSGRVTLRAKWHQLWRRGVSRPQTPAGVATVSAAPVGVAVVDWRAALL